MDDIHAIKPPIETPVFTHNMIVLFWVFLGLLVLSGLAFIFYYFWKKRKLAALDVQVEESIPQKTKEESRQIAKNKLLEARKYIDVLEYKKFHLKASAIIREYLFNICNEKFTDMTTRELLQNPKLPSRNRENIENFFRLTDLANFATEHREKEVAERTYELALLIIK